MPTSTGPVGDAPGEDQNDPPEIGVARRIPPQAQSPHFRLKRLERLAYVLDRSIPLGRWRIGLDPILGLLPGAGDTIGGLLSLYVVYEAARLGAPGRLLARMTGNILVETVLGTIPLLGDLFDFVWQANTRNLALIHRHYGPAWQERPLGAVWAAVLLTALGVFALVGTLAFFAIKFVVDRIGW